MSGNENSNKSKSSHAGSGSRNKSKAARARKVRQIKILIGSGAVLVLLLVVLLVMALSNKKTDGGKKDQNESAGLTVDDRETQSTDEASTSGETQPVTESKNEQVTGTLQPTSERETTSFNLESIDNTASSFGYADSNRASNMVPTDWKWYANKWSGYKVDWIQDTSKNIIYLTMDEGFANDYTATILDTLKAKNVKVVFFLTQNFIEGKPDLVQRMIDEGHQLGNHTCNHPNMPSIGIEKETTEIMTLHNMVKEKFGYEMRLFRYPQGVFSSQSLALVNNLGYKAVFWSYAYNDYNPDVQISQEEALERAVKYLHPGAIYLLHANSSTNTAMLGDFIDQARAKGFEFGVYPAD
ncbi:MAG: polysaccharide deacetylase family protein [Lachnospira sp.]